MKYSDDILIRFGEWRPPKNKKVKSRSAYNLEFTKLSKKLKEIRPSCEQCGKDNYLMVHHKDKNKENNKLENLEVLCFDCHKKHHPHLRIPPWMK